MTDNNIEHIRSAVDKEALLSELTEERFVRKTKKLNNEVYILNAHNAPNVMQEIGRLRELAFSLSGGGTGEEVDIDEKDISENPYEQLIVFSREDFEIIGGYRFFQGNRSIDPNHSELSTASYFHFSNQFIEEYLPHTLELGRSWIHPDFQVSVNPRKGIFALDNLWDGLGSLSYLYPEMKYFFGKVTMYSSYDSLAKSAVLSYMKKYFPDRDRLVWSKYPPEFSVHNEEFLQLVEGQSREIALRSLKKYCHARNTGIPPLIKKYMELTPTMKTFGTAQNQDFGGVDETGILITIDDIYPDKKERYTPSAEEIIYRR